MKIAVTGHTKGIGKSIFEYFAKNNIVTGFATSNGYDISLEQSRLLILEQVKNYDIFVNNAYHNYDNSQLEMLKLISSAWKDTDKIVINISSRYTNADNAYSITKKQLNDFCADHVYDNLYILNICPGLVDTDRVKHESGKKMPASEIISVIDFALNNLGRFKLHNITFGL